MEALSCLISRLLRVLPRPHLVGIVRTLEAEMERMYQPGTTSFRNMERLEVYFRPVKLSGSISTFVGGWLGLQT